MLDGNLASYPKNATSPQEIMPYSPLIGTRNGVSPRFVLHYAGKHVKGEGVFPPLFTGPPDTAHGGMVAALFDELLTAVVLRNGPAAFTASLTVQYRQRIRIGEKVTLSAEITGREGRKIHTYGELFQQGVLAATAEALFIEPRQPGEEKP
jgi:acyl-coenzyme A thioesterase PaaI-like protein